ncbi:hypothetical protein OSB04_030095 [Centaurea solstitialis]|uniref:Cytochrome P450 n=1 Tax=Centaurea solstitialis TaxID=347529 RepID=A0AA38VWD5_9ASTR|nr:hypothetical protein OSB04_030095 [Centaurea solstitialis]
MDTIITIFVVVSSLILSLYFLVLNKKTKSLNLPPGPPKLPLIGNLHQVSGKLPHRVFRDLAQKYGPVMHLKLGQVNTIVISSPRLAKEVLKTNDMAIADRPVMLIADMVLGDRGVILAQYGDHWRQMKKIMSLQLLSAKKVRSIQRIREEQIGRMMEFYRLSNGNPVNIHTKVAETINTILCISSLGSKCRQQERLIEFMEEMERETGVLLDMFPSLEFVDRLIRNSIFKRLKKTYDDLLDDILDEHHMRKRDHDQQQQEVDEEEEGLLGSLLRMREEGGLEFPITNNVIKAMFVDVFAGGTDTSTATIEWAMTELITHPIIMEKVQTEIRAAFKGKTVITEADLQELSCLQCIIKETLRLHPPLPLLVPHGTREEFKVDGYDIPVNQRLFINGWACSTDPEYWEEPNSFKPERFEKTLVDLTGNDYQFIPFGSGRRICPGIHFGLRTVEFFLAHMLNNYDWNLPHGLNPSNLDTTETLRGGVLMIKNDPLTLIPTPYSSA